MVIDTKAINAGDGLMHPAQGNRFHDTTPKFAKPSKSTKKNVTRAKRKR